MSTVDLIVIIVVAVLLVLLLGGYVANARRRRVDEASLRERARKADTALAQAHAADNGWDRAALETAARRIYADRHGTEPASLLLVQVIDRPGIEEDEAIFEDGEGRSLALARRGDGWVAGEEGRQQRP